MLQVLSKYTQMNFYVTFLIQEMSGLAINEMYTVHKNITLYVACSIVLGFEVYIFIIYLFRLCWIAGI